MTPITVTKSYITEVINVMVISTAAPLLYVICFRPLPVAAAQLSYSSVYSCFTLIVALGAAISCFQTLYVVKFDLLFSLNPQDVGRRTFQVGRHLRMNSKAACELQI
jgi:hypothetical protein